MRWSWRERRANYAVLRRAVAAEALRVESLSYEALLAMGDERAEPRVFESRPLMFLVEIWERRADCDLEIFVSAEGLPTLLGIKPGHHFFKRPDSSVYY